MLPVLNILPFSSFTMWTPVIPKMYWDVFSAEQRMKAICERLSKSEQYMDYVAGTVNGYTQGLDEEVEKALREVREEMAALDATIHQDMDTLDADLRDEMLGLFHRMNNLEAELIELILSVAQSNLTWDCQHGEFTDSKTGMRDMFNDLTCHAMTCAELAMYDITVDELAESGLNVAGFAVMNRYLVDTTEPLYPPYRYTL